MAFPLSPENSWDNLAPMECLETVVFKIVFIQQYQLVMPSRIGADTMKVQRQRQKGAIDSCVGEQTAVGLAVVGRFLS
jgi:hypothetical protein